jgi:signal transduction histidine kinase
LEIGQPPKVVPGDLMPPSPRERSSTRGSKGADPEGGSESLSTSPSDSEEAIVLAAVRRIAQALVRPAELERLFRLVCDEVERVLPADAVTTCTLDPGSDVLRVRVGSGGLSGLEGRLLPIEGSFAGGAALAGKPLRTDSLPHDPRSFRPAARGLRLGAAIAVPLTIPDRTVGVLLAARDPEADPFDDRAIRMLQQLADVVAVALENARLHRQARRSRAEVAAWRRENELVGWRQRFETAASLFGHTVFEWDPRSDSMIWSSNAERSIAGPDGLPSTLEEWLEGLADADRVGFARELRYAAESGESAGLDVRLLHPSGAHRLCVVRIAVRPSPDGNRVVGVIQEIAFRPEPAEAESQMDGAKQIIRALRHEINNPLAVVMGQAQLLQREKSVSADPALHQSVSAIFEETRRMQDSLKRLAHLESSARDLLDHLSGLPGFSPSRD